MPDTYKTFLSPGSCQLEVTDLVASANDDKGVDLYGVAWEIEQVLIAGEGFAASPTDVWVNERGILNIGQSLFDKINRTAEDNDNVPGQCTVVVKATSLVDSSKVARLKVLVGYPGEGGGGGGGTATITVLELVGDEPTSQPSFKVETIGGEQIAVTPTTAVVGGEETPVYTFSATAGDVIVISVTDENLTFAVGSTGGSWYSSAFDRPRTLYPSMINEQEGQMTLIAASGSSCVLASLTSRSD